MPLVYLYSYEAEFIQTNLSTGKKQLAFRFNLTYRYVDDALSINNQAFEKYPAEFEITDTTESITSGFFLKFTTADWE